MYSRNFSLNATTFLVCVQMNQRIFCLNHRVMLPIGLVPAEQHLTATFKNVVILAKLSVRLAGRRRFLKISDLAAYGEQCRILAEIS